MNSEISYPIIALAESEKFRNAAGEVCEVEVRGERSFDKCYFKVKDVGRVFGIKRLEDNITNIRSRYTEGIHYISCLREDRASKTSDAMRFFTYKGLMTWVLNAKGVETDSYVNWMMKTLFTVQFGNQEERKVLAKKIKNPSYSAFKDMTDINVNQIGGIYLFKIGSVKHLRKALTLPKYDRMDDRYNDDELIKFSDDNDIYKFGYSKNLLKRFEAHRAKYGKLSTRVNVELIYYAQIDEEHLREAEDEIKNEFEDYRVIRKGHREFLTLSEDQIRDECKIVFKRICEKYGQTNMKLREQLNEAKNKLDRDNEFFTIMRNENHELRNQLKEALSLAKCYSERFYKHIIRDESESESVCDSDDE